MQPGGGESALSGIVRISQDCGEAKPGRSRMAVGSRQPDRAGVLTLPQVRQALVEYRYQERRESFGGGSGGSP